MTTQSGTPMLTEHARELSLAHDVEDGVHAQAELHERVYQLQRELAARTAELEEARRDAERYRHLRGAIRGIHIEPGARGTGIHTWALQICEPFPVMTQGDLLNSEIDAAVDAAMLGKP